MNILQQLAAKRESFSAHMAWGFGILGIAHVNMAQGLFGGLILGVAWEVISAGITQRTLKWKPNPLDFISWICGGLLAGAMWQGWTWIKTF